MGPNATGSRQIDRGHVPQRLKNRGGSEKYLRELDNSGNIEGSPNALFLPRAAAASPVASARLPRPRARDKMLSAKAPVLGCPA